MLTIWAIAPPTFGVALSVVKAGLPAAAAMPSTRMWWPRR